MLQNKHNGKNNYMLIKVSREKNQYIGKFQNSCIWIWTTEFALAKIPPANPATEEIQVQPMPVIQIQRSLGSWLIVFNTAEYLNS